MATLDINKYINLKGKYELYLNKMGLYFKKLNIDSVFTLTFLIDICLQNGYFSIDKSFTYYNYANDEEELIDFLGVRVLEGKAVCRHAASFMCDLLNKMGFNSVVLGGISATFQTLGDNILTINKPNHTTTFINKNDISFVYNTFSKHEVSSCLDKVLIKNNTSIFFKPITGDDYYFLPEAEQEFFNFHRTSELDTCSKSKLTKLNIDELRKNLSDAYKIYYQEQDNLNKLYLEMSPIMEEIVSLSNDLFYHSDIEVKKLVFKKD
jgi:hypothetical protein